jgi:hypothetical protein
MALVAKMDLEENADLNMAIKQSKNAKKAPCISHKYYF